MRLLAVAIGAGLGIAPVAAILLVIAAVLGFLWNTVAISAGFPTLELWQSFVIVVIAWILKKFV